MVEWVRLPEHMAKFIKEVMDRTASSGEQWKIELSAGPISNCNETRTEAFTTGPPPAAAPPTPAGPTEAQLLQEAAALRLKIEGIHKKVIGGADVVPNIGTLLSEIRLRGGFGAVRDWAMLATSLGMKGQNRGNLLKRFVSDHVMDLADPRHAPAKAGPTPAAPLAGAGADVQGACAPSPMQYTPPQTCAEAAIPQQQQQQQIVEEVQVEPEGPKDDYSFPESDDESPGMPSPRSKRKKANAAVASLCKDLGGGWDAEEYCAGESLAPLEKKRRKVEKKKVVECADQDIVWV